MKRILFILHLPPPVHGASMVGKFISQSNAIKSIFHGRFINLSTSQTVDEIGKNSLLKGARYISLAFKILWQLIEYRPNLIYMTISSGGPGFYKDFPLAMLSKLMRVKRVYHLHNKGIKNYQDRYLDDKLYRMVFRNSKVILLSEYLYPDIQKYLPKSDVYYCANGIPGNISVNDSDSVLGRKINEKQISNGDYTSLVEILFLSNLIKSKGIYILLETCQLLSKRKLNFHITIVGDAGDITVKQLQQKIIELELISQVTYVGRQIGREKKIYFQRADLFVHPTYEDCQPLVILEAMQHGLPVVSTFEGAIPEIVRDGESGLLVPKHDAYALADKLEVLIKNPSLRASMGAAGHNLFLREYTLEAFEMRFVKIMNDILSKSLFEIST